MTRRKVLIRLVVIASGVGFLLLSLFAFQLGLDNDPGWGPRRFQILAAGIAVFLFGALYWITPAVTRRLRRTDESLPRGGEETGSGVAARSKRTDLWLILVGCLVVLACLKHVPPFLWKGALLTVGPLLGVLMTVEDFLAPFEIMKILGNVLSYARLMALGMAHNTPGVGNWVLGTE